MLLFFFNGEASKEVILQFSSSCLHNFLQVNTRKLHPTQGSKMEQGMVLMGPALPVKVHVLTHCRHHRGVAQGIKQAGRKLFFQKNSTSLETWNQFPRCHLVFSYSIQSDNLPSLFQHS